MKQHALLGAWRGRDGDIHVIPNAVRTDLFTPEKCTEARRRLGLSDEDTALLFVALDVLDPRKGFDDLLRSYLRLAQFRKDLHLLLVGRLSALPDELAQFRDRVRVCGFIDEDEKLAEIYAAADLYVVPSHADTFNITILEAMSCGTPTLAYASGGIAEVIEDGCGGWLIEEGSPQALMEALSQKLDKLASPDLREAARKYVLENFSIQQVLSKHVELYERLVVRCASPSARPALTSNRDEN
jgi:glycosyltransferase involved in cell wall biosynthesis